MAQVNQAHELSTAELAGQRLEAIPRGGRVWVDSIVLEAHDLLQDLPHLFARPRMKISESGDAEFHCILAWRGWSRSLDWVLHETAAGRPRYFGEVIVRIDGDGVLISLYRNPPILSEDQGIP